MALCQENITHTMLNSGRPSPTTYFSPYGGTYGPGSQANGANGATLGPGQYGSEHGHYAQFHVPPTLMHGYGDPAVQHQTTDGNGTPTHSQWSSSPYPVPPRPAHVALDEWSQSYLLPTSNGTTTTLHPHQSPYNYPYRSPTGLDGYGTQGPHNPHPGVETSPSNDSSSPPSGGSGGGGAASTKQLRPPYEWMKPANTQPQPGKTRTKDKYRVVYSDHQRLELEKEFHFSRYITIRRKAEIAQQLSLSERQVKIWFQNRRAKERKQNKKRDEAMRASGNLTTPKLEPLDSPPPINAPHHAHPNAHSPNMGMGLGMNQHHVMAQQPMGAAGSGMEAVNHNHSHHLPSPIPQNQGQQHYPAPHRLSPVASQGVGMGGHETLPQTATPTVSQQMQVPVSVSCSTSSMRAQNVATPIYEEKREIV